MSKVIDFYKAKNNETQDYSTKLDIEADEIDIKFLTFIILLGSTSYECVDMILKHFKLKEVLLENGMKLYRDKIGGLAVQFEADGYSDSMGLGLFLAISKVQCQKNNYVGGR